MSRLPHGLPPGVFFCDICMACTCPLRESGLLSFFLQYDPVDPTREDDVAWLSHFYILGRDSALSAINTECGYFMTDVCRRRNDKIQIHRGDAATGVNFGNTSCIRGDGANEVLSMKLFDIDAHIRPLKRPGVGELDDHWVIVHQRCYEAIFLRVLKRFGMNGIIPHQSHATYGAYYETFLKAELRTRNELKYCDTDRPSIRPLPRSSRGEDSVDNPKNRRVGATRPVHMTSPLICSGLLMRSRLFGLAVAVSILYYPRSSWAELISRALSQWTEDSRSASATKTPLLQALAPDFKARVSNSFEALPIDIAVLIALHLDTRDVLKMSLASSVTSLKLDLAKFWKIKLRRDIPWIWELTEGHVVDGVNWREAYFDIWDRCNWNASNRDLGLVNRKIIWRTCEKLVPKFLEKRAEIIEREMREESV